MKVHFLRGASLWLVILLSLTVWGCGNKLSRETKPIHIQPFTGADTQIVNSAIRQLQGTIPGIKIYPAIALPPAAWSPARRRYRADSLLNFLNLLSGDSMILIGITSHDISTKKGTIPDWGVMGLGYMPGTACISSTYRLKGDKANQLYKLCLHELGHNMGLPHCPQPYCYMRDAEGKNHFDEMTGFCMTCAIQLKKRGLAFSQLQ